MTLVPFVALLALNASAQQVAAPLPSLVTASGEAEIKVAPDMATIRIGVTSDAKTAKEAQTKTSDLTNRLIAAALKVVPDPKSFQTSDLSLEPQYAPASSIIGINGRVDLPPVIVGYQARNFLNVRLDDVSKVSALIDAITAAGATNVDSIAFGLKDDKPFRRQALIDAVRDARDKAEAMAAGLGMKVNGVYSVEEGGGTVVRPYQFQMRAKAVDTPVLPGEVSTSASVTVRFVLSY